MTTQLVVWCAFSAHNNEPYSQRLYARVFLLISSLWASHNPTWMIAMPSSTNPAYCTQIGPQKGGQNFDRRLLSTLLDSGTRPYMPGKRATSRVERAIILLTALKPDRMGAERARLQNKEQRYPFVVSHSLTHSEIRDQISCVIHTTN